MTVKSLLIQTCIGIIKCLLWILDSDHRSRTKITTDNIKKFTHVQPQVFKSDFGHVTNAFRTVPYQTWELKTNNHVLVGADKHRVIREDGTCAWIEELLPGDRILTSIGVDTVTYAKNLGIRTHMYCVEVHTPDPLDPKNHLYYTNGILSHNTTCAAAYLLWFAIFQEDVNVLIAANKFNAATEIMDRVRFSYEELPDWLRPGVVTWNVQKIQFDNKSKIASTTTTPDSGRGKSISLLYLDEFAFVKTRIAEEFWSAIGPTLATGGKCIITSTPNSDEDTFAQIWYGACNTLDEFGNDRTDGLGANGFKAFKATWDQHPERDETWAATERAKYGEEKFAREYELKFLTADETLIDSRTLLTLVPQEPKFKMGEIRWWEPPEANKIYLVSLDPSTGVGKDYSAIQVWKLPDMIQVAEWMHNKSSVAQQIKCVIQVCVLLDQKIRQLPLQMGEPELFWTFENNGVGHSVVELLNEVGLDRIPAQLMSDPGRRGYNSNVRTKSQAVVKFKSLVESNRCVIRSKPLISEMKNFVSKGDSFAAKAGEHDDLVTATLLIVRMSQQISKWDERTAEQFASQELADLEQILEPMPVSVGW